VSKFFIRPSIWLVAVVAIAAGAALATLDLGQAQSPTTGRVRVMHASADTPAVDIFVDGQKAVTGLAFPKDTGYVPLPAGSHDVKVFVSPSDGTGTPALQATLQVVAGKDYTVLAIGEVTKNTLELLPLEDNNALPAAGQAHVRLVHASPDAPPVDVVVAGTATKVFSNVAYKSVGAYTPVPVGTYNLDVQVSSSSQTVKSVTGLALGERGVYTVVATGPAASLQVVPLLDVQPSAPAAPTAPASPAAPSTGSGLPDVADNGAQMAVLAGALVLLGSAGIAGSAAVARVRSSRND